MLYDFENALDADLSEEACGVDAEQFAAVAWRVVLVHKSAGRVEDEILAPRCQSHG